MGVLALDPEVELRLSGRQVFESEVVLQCSLKLSQIASAVCADCTSLHHLTSNAFHAISAA